MATLHVNKRDLSGAVDPYLQYQKICHISHVPSDKTFSTRWTGLTMTADVKCQENKPSVSKSE